MIDGILSSGYRQKANQSLFSYVTIGGNACALELERSDDLLRARATAFRAARYEGSIFLNTDSILPQAGRRSL